MKSSNVVYCHFHGETVGFGGRDNPRCLRCAKRHAEARRTGADVGKLLQKDKERKER